jgi:periplasmic protein TonB
MLAYAASAPRTAERSSSPNALLAIIAGHVALVAVVMSAKMDLPARFIDRPITIIPIRPVEPPPPNPPVERTPRPQPGPTATDPTVPLHSPGPDVVPIPSPPDPMPMPGPSVDPVPQPTPRPLPPVHLGAQLLTPPSELRPPYPAAKLLAEEEATLKLRLTIDERGRVTAVDPVGRADAVFLAAARRHLLAHWRFKPASDDGRAVASTTVITLRFQLDG